MTEAGAQGSGSGPEPSARLGLVVLGDSLAFTDHRGPQLPDDPHLFPSVVASELSSRLDRPVELTVLARPGWTVREVWRALTKDRHVQFEVLARADAVVVAIGSFDHVPTGVPGPVDAVVPYLRPAALRRQVRRLLRAAHPRVVALTGGRFPLTPTGEFTRLYELVLRQVAGLTRGAPRAVLGPVGQAAAFYDRRNPHLAARVALQQEVAARVGYPFVAAWPDVVAHLDQLNPDGIHWPHEVHVAVGVRLARVLAPQLRPAGDPGRTDRTDGSPTSERGQDYTLG